MAGFGCCTGKGIFGGGSTTGGGLIIDPGGPSRPGSNSIPGVKCYCQESILVRINIDVKEFKDRINPKSLFRSHVKVIRLSGCKEKKWKGRAADNDFRVSTDGVPGEGDWSLSITWSTGQNCGDCAPTVDIHNKKSGFPKPFAGTDACAFIKGTSIMVNSHLCKCRVTGALPHPPCECGVVFKLVNDIKYAQKCVLACEAKRPINCYWLKLGVMGQLLEPLKPGYVLSRRWNTKYCKVRNEPWKTKLITDVTAYLISIGSPVLQGCKKTIEDCNGIQRKK